MSNIGQTGDTGVTTNGGAIAQGFTTGSSTGGYALSSIQAVVGLAPNTAQRATVRAQLWSATTAGAPSTKVADLAVPSSVSSGTVSFTAPANTTLTASTTYYFVIYTTGNFNLGMGDTAATTLDSGAETGWSIGSRYHQTRNAPTVGGWGNPSTGKIRIAVKGAAASSDATLRGLTAQSAPDTTDTNFTPLALSPSFDAETTSYTASVPYSTTHVKLTPTVNESNATVGVRKGSTGNFATVTSGMASAAIDLAAGSNAITVRVTAQNSATKDYTVTITRQRQQATRPQMTGLTVNDGVRDLPLKPNVANAVGLGGPGIYAVMVNPDLRSLTFTLTLNENTVGMTAYVRNASRGIRSPVTETVAWTVSESGQTKTISLPGHVTLVSISPITGSGTYRIYVYHNRDWESANNRLRQLVIHPSGN